MRYPALTSTCVVEMRPRSLRSLAHQVFDNWTPLFSTRTRGYGRWGYHCGTTFGTTLGGCSMESSCGTGRLDSVGLLEARLRGVGCRVVSYRRSGRGWRGSRECVR